MSEQRMSQRLPRQFHRDVQQRVRANLAAEQLDGVLVDDWRDVAWLTGFFHTPTERPVAVLLDESDVVMLVPALEGEYAASQDPCVDRIVTYPEYPGVVPPFAALADAATSATGTRRYGHGPDLAVGVLAQLQEVFDATEWTRSAIIQRGRLVKHPLEVQLHRAAAHMGDVMLGAGLELVTEAVSAGDVLPSEAELVDHVVTAGKQWMQATHRDIVVVPMLTGGLVYSGANSAHPHGLATSHRLQPGETFILSLGGAVGGRYAESERTFFLGEPTDRQRRLFEADARAQQVGTDLIRPGARCCDVNAACLDVIRDAGFGEYIRHRQGHGIGLNFHEPPWLEDGDDTVLRPGMVVSSEPGIYVPGHAGYRISDTVLVTEDGHERLTRFPRDLDASVIDL